MDRAGLSEHYFMVDWSTTKEPRLSRGWNLFIVNRAREPVSESDFGIAFRMPLGIASWIQFWNLGVARFLNCSLKRVLNRLLKHVFEQVIETVIVNLGTPPVPTRLSRLQNLVRGGPGGIWTRGPTEQG